MITGIAIRKNQYYDSVFLMGINQRISKVEGVTQSAVLMGSEANKEVFANLGFFEAKIKTASANDLVVAVEAENQKALEEALSHMDEWLSSATGKKGITEIRSLEQAMAVQPAANLVVISVPGEFAAHEARKSLEAGKHVFLFSDNVKLEDEIALKRYAQSHGLLLMGPDCGTSILKGIGIGFANCVRRGKIGVIGAAGTGLQEFTCMVHNGGYGISQAIGTGSRDLKDEVGGITTLMALEALEEDPETEVVALISKPPGEKTLAGVVERIKTYTKPVIGCFLGIPGEIEGEGQYFKRARIIDDAVSLAIQAIGGRLPAVAEIKPEQHPLGEGNPRFLRGIFAGGTFCYQAQQIMREAKIPVYSNAPLEKKYSLEHPDQSRMNTIVDMGDEYYMVGRPHPMIDGGQRAMRILKEANDPEVGILLLDFILGYNASRDPVGELIEAIQEAKRIARKQGRELEIVASICGTEGDPQDLKLQTKLLKECGVVVFRSNAQATSYCAHALAEASHARRN